MRLYLIRHWKTERNIADILNGQMDDLLSEEWKEQAHTLAKKLSNIQFDSIRSSDLSRAYDTAQIIASYQPNPIVVQTDTKLRERYFWLYEGRPIEYLRTTSKKAGYEYMSDYYNYDTEIEHSTAIVQRVQAFLDNNIIHTDQQTIGIISHGSTLREYLSHHLNIHWSDYLWHFMPIENTGLTILDIDTDKNLTRIVTYNDFSHLY